ncbi:GH3 auxin-responsive promoter family protein [Leptolyngbya sp. 15MV]|nr:GH3 auxin-responsive promoter family protein [Leptolyngbya sp. 15MV]
MMASNFKASLDIFAHMRRFGLPLHRVTAGRCLFLGGSTDLETNAHGIRTGDLSALVTGLIKWPISEVYSPGPAIALMKHWPSKIDAMARLALTQDVRFISGVPSWAIMLFERVIAIAREQGHDVSTIRQIWPNLQIFVHGGVKYAPFDPRVRQFWSGAPDGDDLPYRLELYPASEGFIAMQDTRADPGLRLMSDIGNFYEFVPLERINDPDPEAFTCDRVEKGQKYVVVMSTCSGLWRYIIGDVVEFDTIPASPDGRGGEGPCRLRIVGRHKHFMNAFGENLIGEHIELAVAAASRATGLIVGEFTAAPVYPKEGQRGSVQLEARLRDAAFARLLEDGAADPRPVGERAALVVDRIEAMEGFLTRWLPAAVLAIAAPAMVAGAAAIADPTSGLILGLAGLLVPVAMAVTGIGAAQASRRQFAALDQLSGRFLDRMRGLPTLVLFRRQEAEAEALGAAAAELRRRTMKVLRIAFLSSASLEVLAAGAIACLAIRHGAVLGAAHPDPVAAIFCLLLVPAFFQPLRTFSQSYHERLAARGAAADLAPLLDAPMAEGLRLESMPPRVVVTFTDVRLTYDPTRPPALDGLSFRVMPGETLVLSGPSGAGKSSVLRLLMGFRRPDSGRIALNGQDATALRPSELRRLSAYVGQRAHLFRGTLRASIPIGAGSTHSPKCR